MQVLAYPRITIVLAILLTIKYVWMVTSRYRLGDFHFFLCWVIGPSGRRLGLQVIAKITGLPLARKIQDISVVYDLVYGTNSGHTATLRPSLAPVATKQLSRSLRSAAFRAAYSARLEFTRGGFSGGAVFELVTGKEEVTFHVWFLILGLSWGVRGRLTYPVLRAA